MMNKNRMKGLFIFFLLVVSMLSFNALNVLAVGVGGGCTCVGPTWEGGAPPEGYYVCTASCSCAVGYYASGDCTYQNNACSNNAACIPYCQGTDTSCGVTSCTNCNSLDQECNYATGLRTDNVCINTAEGDACRPVEADPYCEATCCNTKDGCQADGLYHDYGCSGNSCVESTPICTPNCCAGGTCVDNVCRTDIVDFNSFGSEAQISKIWSMGNEYLTRSYDKNDNPVKEVKRYFDTELHIAVKFGDVKRNSPHPLFGLRAINYPDYVENAFGVASGTLRLTKTEMINYDLVGRGKSNFKVENFFELVSGLPSYVLRYNKDLEGETVIKEEFTYEFQENDALGTDSSDKHILSFPKKIITSKDDVIESASEINYLEKETGRWLVDQNKNWENLDGDNVIDANELKTKIIHDTYDRFGNIIKKVNAKGAYEITTYDGFGRAESGTNSENEPKETWSRTFNNYGLIETETDINDDVTTYYYDSYLRLSKIVESNDDVNNPTVEFFYTEYTSSSSPKSIKKETKMDATRTAINIQFFDGFNRLIQTQDLVSGSNYIVNAIEFDNLGRQSKIYKPVEVSTSGNYKTIAQLETLNGVNNLLYTEFIYYPEPGEKVWKKIQPDGTFIEYKYGSINGLPTTTTIDERGHSTRYTYDLLGRLLKVEQGKTD